MRFPLLGLATLAFGALGCQMRSEPTFVHVGSVVQMNPYPKSALEAHGIHPRSTGGAWIDGYSVPIAELWEARRIMIEDAQEHRYSLTIPIDPTHWKHIDRGIEDPKIYSTPYSEAFMSDRSIAASRRRPTRA